MSNLQTMFAGYNEKDIQNQLQFFKLLLEETASAAMIKEMSNPAASTSPKFGGSEFGASMNDDVDNP